MKNKEGNIEDNNNIQKNSKFSKALKTWLRQIKITNNPFGLLVKEFLIRWEVYPKIEDSWVHNTKVISYDEKKVRDFSEQRFIKKHGGYINNDKEMSKKLLNQYIQYLK